MQLNTPSFWYHNKGVAAKSKAAALAAFSGIYAIAHGLHQTLARPVRAPIAVICVGNLVVGGGGKTPTAIALMKLIKKEGLFQNPCYLTRGYGGTLKGPVALDRTSHTATQTGDEALVLAQTAPVIIAHDRAKGACYAAAQGHDVIIMDDGMQNPHLHKDLSILVIDGHTGFGNGLLLPAGPLRTPINTGMKKCNCVLLIGDDKTQALDHVPDNVTVLRANTMPLSLLDTIPNYIAFCGIAHPEKFWQTLEQAEMKVIEFQSFPDHHPYDKADLKKLLDRATTLDARLVTTTKDAVKFPQDFLDSGNVDIMVTELNWSENDANMLIKLIEAACRDGKNKY